MQTKLQELTEKIYQEGINKANEEAESILANAKDESRNLIAKANKEAQELVENAQKEAEELKKNSLNELQLSARQAISDLKQKVASLVESKTIKPGTKEAFKDAQFVKDIIKTIVKNWNPESGEAIHLKMVLPAQQQKELEDYFKSEASELLNNKLEVSFSDKLKGGFKIGPKDGGFMVSFTDDDFENFFQAFMRPKLIEFLFGATK